MWRLTWQSPPAPQPNSLSGSVASEGEITPMTQPCQQSQPPLLSTPGSCTRETCLRVWFSWITAGSALMHSSTVQHMAQTARGTSGGFAGA